MLILFDIDGTLLSTSGAGIRAMGHAGRAVFGPRFTTEGVPFAGRLDPLIMREMLVNAGVEPTSGAMAKFREAYVNALPAELERAEANARALPGVLELLDTLVATRSGRMTLGVLTGNFDVTGTMKLRACGVRTEHFAVCVWGDDSPSNPPTRDDLPRVGMQRYEQLHRRTLPGERVVVIGDTPHDVRCAQVNGCRSIGVATGQHGVEELARCGADLALPNLADLPRVLGFLDQVAGA
jgi:phosphoglycolate phosphatase-like HAD superfamily hydrolase